jgi:hypothetical protein
MSLLSELVDLLGMGFRSRGKPECFQRPLIDMRYHSYHGSFELFAVISRADVEEVRISYMTRGNYQSQSDESSGATVCGYHDNRPQICYLEGQYTVYHNAIDVPKNINFRRYN